MNTIKLSWADFKTYIGASSPQIIKNDSSEYRLRLFDGIVLRECTIEKASPRSDDQAEFEDVYLDDADRPTGIKVSTQFEIDDKNLRTVCAFADTDANGEAEVCIPIPEEGRWIAFGDAEFSVRHFGDYLKTLEITDLDRVIAWQIALAQDPGAVAPVADAVVQALGYPDYPVLGYFDERGIPNPLPANTKGTVRGGLAMTFQFGMTEAEPVGGYAWLPGLMYLRIVCKKASGHTTGFSLSCSIDWAKPK